MFSGLFIFIIATAVLMLLITISLIKAAGRPVPDTCSKNQLEGCKGACCTYCELSDSCPIKCKADPKNCGNSLI